MDPGRAGGSTLFEPCRTPGMVSWIPGPGGTGCLWKRGQVLRCHPANSHYDRTVGETVIPLVPER